MLKNRSNFAVPVPAGTGVTRRPGMSMGDQANCQASITWNSGW